MLNPALLQKISPATIQVRAFRFTFSFASCHQQYPKRKTLNLQLLCQTSKICICFHQPHQALGHVTNIRVGWRLPQARMEIILHQATPQSKKKTCPYKVDSRCTSYHQDKYHHLCLNQLPYFLLEDVDNLWRLTNQADFKLMERKQLTKNTAVS